MSSSFESVLPGLYSDEMNAWPKRDSPDVSSDQRPPHSAPARHQPESPLIAAERMLADAASELVDDQYWDTYAQIDDERQRFAGSLGLTDRLAGSLGRTITARIGLPSGETFDVTGPIEEVGHGWLEIAQDGVTHIVSLERIISIVGLDQAMPPGEETGVRREWRARLRGLAGASSAVPVTLLRVDGVRLAVSIAVVGRDYVDVQVLSPEGTRIGPAVSVPFEAIVAVAAR